MQKPKKVRFSAVYTSSVRRARKVAFLLAPLPLQPSKVICYASIKLISHVVYDRPQVVDGFFVKRTRDLKETIAYLTVMTRYLQRLYSVSPRSSPSLCCHTQYSYSWFSCSLIFRLLHRIKPLFAVSREVWSKRCQIAPMETIKSTLWISQTLTTRLWRTR